MIPSAGVDKVTVNTGPPKESPRPLTRFAEACAQIPLSGFAMSCVCRAHAAVKPHAHANIHRKISFVCLSSLLPHAGRKIHRYTMASGKERRRTTGQQCIGFGYFTAPAVMPFVNVLWKMRKKTNAGIREIRLPALIVGTSMMRSPCNDAIASGMV